MALLSATFTFVCDSVAEYDALWAEVAASVFTGQDVNGNRLFEMFRIGDIGDNTFTVKYEHNEFLPGAVT